MAVHRQYSGTLGKTGNCQVAVSLHAAGRRGSSALARRLYLPQVWARDEARRGEAGYGDITEFRRGLESRGLRYAVGVTSLVRVWVEPPSPARHERCPSGRPPLRQ